MSSLVSCLLTETPFEWLWLWLLPAVSRLSFPLSIHTHTRIHIVTIIVYYISWYWQNWHLPEFLLNRPLVPVTNRDTLQTLVHELVCITTPQCIKHGHSCKDYARKAVIKHVYERREHIPFCKGLSDWIMLPNGCSPSSVVFNNVT